MYGRNEQEVTVSLIDVSCGDENISHEIEGFIVGVRRHEKKIYGTELQDNEVKKYRQILPVWNTFLQLTQDSSNTSAIVSLDLNEDIKKFIWREELGGPQYTGAEKEWCKRWLTNWNMFLQARAGKTLVTPLNLYLTLAAFIMYVLDVVSDIGTFIYHLCNGQWWRAIMTWIFIYTAVIINTVWKWRNGYIHCSGASDWLHYVASLLVNWPAVKQYRAFCLLERQLQVSPVRNAHLVPERNHRKRNVVFLKLTEGLFEAFPQAFLQLYFLLPDLYGDITWTSYPRILSVFLSLCKAAAVVVNQEKLSRINNGIKLPLRELVVLYVWAVPVTVSTLLSEALYLSVFPVGFLVAVVGYITLCVTYWRVIKKVPCTVINVIESCQSLVLWFMSPFDVTVSISDRRMCHVIHLVTNSTLTLWWARATLLKIAHHALYTAIICLNAAMYVVGVVAWQLHDKYWPMVTPSTIIVDYWILPK